MAIANMGLSGGSALLGPLRQWFGYSGLLSVAAACSLIVAALLLFLDAERHRHRVTALDVLDVSRHAAPVLT
jgi:predicted MFS family arabinose efflux permease